MIGLITRRRHAAEVARVRADCTDQIARNAEQMQPAADRRARRRAATWLFSRAESYRLDAEHVEHGGPHVTKSDGHLNPTQRRAVEHELEAAANDILRED